MNQTTLMNDCASFSPYSRPGFASSMTQNRTNTSFQTLQPQRRTIKFTRRTEPINWKLLAGVDIDRIAEDLDFACLQRNLLQVTFCNVDAEVDWRYGADQNLVKLFKLSQLISEYLLHSQEYLTETISYLETKCGKLQHMNNALNARCENQEAEMAELKKESKKKKQLIKELQSKISAGAQQFFQCQLCEKGFMSDYFLQNHIQRRHPEASRGNESLHRVGEMERELSELKERLHSTELSLERARSESFFKDQIEILKTTTLGNISEGQISGFQEKILLQLNELQAKYAESQVQLANALRNTKDQTTLQQESEELRRYKDILRKLEIQNEPQRRHEIVQDPIPSPAKPKRPKEKPRSELQELQQSTPKSVKGPSRDVGEERASPVKKEHASETPMGKQDRPDKQTVGRIGTDVLEPTDQPDVGEFEPLESSTEEDSSVETRIPPTWSRSQLLTGALRKDPKLLAKLRPEMEQILASELKKLGIPEDANGISGKTLHSKLKFLEDGRKENYKLQDLSKLRHEYALDIEEYAKEQLQSKGPFRKEFVGVTAEFMPRQEHEAKGKDVKRVLFGNTEPKKRNLDKEIDKPRIPSSPSQQKSPNKQISVPPSTPNKSEVDGLLSDTFSFDESDEITPEPATPHKPSPPRKPSPRKPKGSGRGQPPVDGRGDVPESSGNVQKFVPQTNGLVNGNAQAGFVSTSTIANESDEDCSDWDADISFEMNNMMPGPAPKPRSAIGQTASANSNANLNSTNGVQAAAKNIESKLMSRPASAAKTAGAVDVGLGIQRSVSSSASKAATASQSSAARTTSAVGDSDSEPFSGDDISINGSLNGFDAVLSAKNSHPNPVMSSTLKQGGSGRSGQKGGSPAAPFSKSPSYSTGKQPNLASSVTATNKESVVSVTSFDSETLSDFDN